MLTYDGSEYETPFKIPKVSERACYRWLTQDARGTSLRNVPVNKQFPGKVLMCLKKDVTVERLKYKPKQKRYRHKRVTMHYLYFVSRDFALKHYSEDGRWKAGLWIVPRESLLPFTDVPLF